MKRYRWVTEKLPGWAIAYLEEACLPLEWTVRGLTPEQKQSMNLLGALLELEQQGCIEVWYESGVGVVARAKPQGALRDGQA